MGIKEELLKLLQGVVGEGVPIELTVPEEPAFGHFSTNIAMRLAKQAGKRPIELAEEIAIRVSKAAPKGFLERADAASPGFVNFWMSKKTIHEEFSRIAQDEKFGTSDAMSGKTVMIEFTDPNPFKLFHIGHLMSNTIGEAFSRLEEAAGAKTMRVNYQGDVGLHIAKAVWGMEHLSKEDKNSLIPVEMDSAEQKMDFLGKAYAFGSRAYEERPEAKEAIIRINEQIYTDSDPRTAELYDLGRRWSLEYFETMYERLGTAFAHYFFESEVQAEGLALVLSRKDIFKESDGAIIFPGEEYGLHTRVFVNAKGLPTYEAKELGLNKKKFELYNPDFSIIVTGNEIIDYFKVLKKAMELTMPHVAERTHHVAHGMLRLPTGKMSSRTGDVITAESMIDQVKEKILEKMRDNPDLVGIERDEAAEAIAVGAIKYSILKQNPGQDIIFDFEKSLSFEGDSGPYVQYAYARLKSILRRGNVKWLMENGRQNAGDEVSESDHYPFTITHYTLLDSEVELSLMRKIFEFPDVVAHARERYAPSAAVAYTYKLASLANKFYETTPILKPAFAKAGGDNEDRKQARLALIVVAAHTIKSALGLLGIKAPEKI